MSILTRAFEVKVRAGRILKSYLFYYEDGVHNHKQAAERGRKYGRIVSVEKVDREELYKSIEHIDLNEKLLLPPSDYLGGGIYENDIKIDEILGLKNKRRSNYDRRKKTKDNQRT